MSVTWRSFGTRPFLLLADLPRLLVKRERERRRSFRRASSSWASGQTKPQFAKGLKAYRWRDVFSSTIAPTSLKGWNSKTGRRLFVAASALTVALAHRSMDTWQVRRKSPALSRRLSTCAVSTSIKHSCARRLTSPCSMPGRGILSARRTPPTFRHSKLRSALPTNFRV